MLTPFFPNVELELYEYHNTGEYDDYGPLNDYLLKTIVSADMQPMSPESTLKEFGKILQDTYKVYLNPDVEVNDTDILRIKDETATYEIIGTPVHNNHLLHHKKLFIQKNRKPVKL